jgi:hypothetical protein
VCTLANILKDKLRFSSLQQEKKAAQMEGQESVLVPACCGSGAAYFKGSSNSWVQRPSTSIKSCQRLPSSSRSRFSSLQQQGKGNLRVSLGADTFVFAPESQSSCRRFSSLQQQQPG